MRFSDEILIYKNLIRTLIRFMFWEAIAKPEKPKNKNFLYFEEWYFLVPNIKNLLYFSKNKNSTFNFLYQNH